MLACCMGQFCDLRPASVQATDSPGNDQVLGYRPSGSEEVQSDVVTLPEGNAGDLGAPTLTATSAGPGLINLSWTGDSGGGQSTIVQRSMDTLHWNDIQVLPADAATCADADVRQGLTYFYRVAAVEDGPTRYSAIVQASGGWDPTCLVKCPSAHPNRAFPSAEGFAALARGGRGGGAVYVTTLADYDPELRESVIPGSFRWALEALSGPRTVLFKVGGTITLKSRLRMADERGSFVTIAGQSAPGEGIQLKGEQLEISGHAQDIIIRHIRFRPGYTSDQDWNKDALTIAGGNGGQVSNVMVDHCCCEWGIDENANVWDNTDRITFQYCIFAQGTMFGYHGNDATPGTPLGESHACGFLAGGVDSTDTDTYLTVHHCLIADNMNRNPLFVAGGGIVHMVNNLIYNYGSYATSLYRATNQDKSTRINIIGNQYLKGPAYTLQVERRPVAIDDTILPGTIYVQDNFGSYRTDPSQDDWEIVGGGRGGEFDVQPFDPSKRRMDPWPITGGVPVTTQPAGVIVQDLPPRVGPNYPRLDAVDAGILEELATRTGELGFGPSVENHRKHPFLANGVPPADTDGDGMPDGWETAQGLNPNAADGNEDPDGDGYTNLEEYLNGLVGEN